LELQIYAGLSAGNIAIVQAGLADVSPDEKSKNKNFSMFQVALGASWVFGPPMGGWLSDSSLISWFTYTTPFWVISGFLTGILLLTMFWFRETLQNPKKEKIEILAGVKQIHEAFLLPKFKTAFVVWFVFVSGWWLFEAFLPTYLLQSFNFTPAQIGNFLASMGGTYALFQVLVVQRFTNLKPSSMVKWTLLIAGLSVIGIAFVNSVFALHIMITLFVTSMGFAMPGLITSISNLASPAEQGQVMGISSSIQALATVVMMMMGGWLESFGLTVTVVGGGVLLIAAWVIFMFHFSNQNRLLMATN
jgi:DHA1 family tetracycline resistance protein-like MFS transporter